MGGVNLLQDNLQGKLLNEAEKLDNDGRGG